VPEEGEKKLRDLEYCSVTEKHKLGGYRGCTCYKNHRIRMGGRKYEGVVARPRRTQKVPTEGNPVRESCNCVGRRAAIASDHVKKCGAKDVLVGKG